MGGSFETSDEQSSPHHRPIRVPSRREDIWAAAKEMADDLEGWKVVEADDDRRVLVATRDGGFLAGSSTLTVTVDGLADVPSTTIQAKSETKGGLLARDKGHVAHFMKLLYRRVC